MVPDPDAGADEDDGEGSKAPDESTLRAATTDEPAALTRTKRTR